MDGTTIEQLVRWHQKMTTALAAKHVDLTRLHVKELADALRVEINRRGEELGKPKS